MLLVLTVSQEARELVGPQDQVELLGLQVLMVKTEIKAPLDYRVRLVIPVHREHQDLLDSLGALVFRALWVQLADKDPPELMGLREPRVQLDSPELLAILETREVPDNRVSQEPKVSKDREVQMVNQVPLGPQDLKGPRVARDRRAVMGSQDP